jgi:hypothetical protein
MNYALKSQNIPVVNQLVRSKNNWRVTALIGQTGYD